jgi:hypothetical protein
VIGGALMIELPTAPRCHRQFALLGEHLVEHIGTHGLQTRHRRSRHPTG